MKKFTKFLLFTAFLISLSPLNTLASSLEKLPATESSKQWKVVIDKAEHKVSKPNQSNKPHSYKIYSMDVENIGSDNVEIVRIEAYRDEPNTTMEYELFTADYNVIKPIQNSFRINNFPLYTKATKLTVNVTWTKKSEKTEYPRKYREQFVFQQ